MSTLVRDWRPKVPGAGGGSLPSIDAVAFYRTDASGTSYAYNVSATEFVREGAGITLANSAITAYKPAINSITGGIYQLQLAANATIQFASVLLNAGNLFIPQCGSVKLVAELISSSSINLTASSVTVSLSLGSTGLDFDMVSFSNATQITVGAMTWTSGAMWSWDLTACALNAAALDSFFIALAATSPFSQIATISANGAGNGAPTSASLSARMSLTSAGITISTN